MLFATVGLIVIGILTIYASGNPIESNPGAQNNAFEGLWKKQVVFAIAGLAALIAVNIINYRQLGRLSYWIYGLVLGALVILLLDKIIDFPFVPVVNNARRWIRLGAGRQYIQLQPSEFCKLAYILAMAWYLRYRNNCRSLGALIGPFALTLLPMVLILAEPDLGTVILMMPILFVMLFIAGAKAKHLLLIILCAVLVSPFLWHSMEPYQRTRISSVLLQNRWVLDKARTNPTLGRILAGDPAKLNTWDENEGFQLKHSKFAIAAGGLTGNGFRKGPYIKYNFLPYRHNDFAFSIIAHQWGFLGCLVLFGLYIIIVACGLEIAWLNTDPFGRLAAVGITAMIAVQALTNISMALGLMPITGLTLPFVSYGGSSLVVNMLAIGLLNNIGRCRPFSVAGEPFQYE